MYIKIIISIIGLCALINTFQILTDVKFKRKFRNDKIDLQITRQLDGQYYYENDVLSFKYPEKLNLCKPCASRSYPNTSYYSDGIISLAVTIDKKLSPLNFKYSILYPDNDEEMKIRNSINFQLQDAGEKPSNKNIKSFVKIDSILFDRNKGKTRHYYTVLDEPFYTEVIEDGWDGFAYSNNNIYHLEKRKNFHLQYNVNDTGGFIFIKRGEKAIKVEITKEYSNGGNIPIPYKLNKEEILDIMKAIRLK